MRNEIKYEWCYETVIDGDIEEVDFEENLDSFGSNRKTDTLCLVRNEGNEIDGLLDRLYAYVENGKLPLFFEDSNIEIPKRFYKELESHLN